MKQTYLFIWFFSLFLPYLAEYVATYLFGTSTWNAFGMFYYFAGFNGYLLLGHYVKKRNDWGMGKTFLICTVLSAVGYYVTYFGFTAAVADLNHAEMDMELFFTFCSPNVACMTLAVKLFANLTQCGFGVYTVHYFLVGPFFLLIGPSSLPIPLQVALMAVCIFVSSWLFTALIYKLMPRKAHWIMG